MTTTNETIRYATAIMAEMVRNLRASHVSESIINNAICTTAANLCGNDYGYVMAELIPGIYACNACAEDIEFSGISDGEGYLMLTGRTGNFYASCNLCGAHATHEVTHRFQEDK